LPVRTLTGVLDANIIVGLAKGDVFELLGSLYSTLYVPRSVTEEVIRQGRGRAGENELTQAVGTWITEVTPDPGTLALFSALRASADQEVLAVAHDRAVDHILSGDERLHREAARRGWTCLRPTQVVLLLKQEGLIPAVKPILDRMRLRGFGIAEVIYQDALRDAGE
jgi:predicted nucleic acid-binding protein